MHDRRGGLSSTTVSRPSSSDAAAERQQVRSPGVVSMQQPRWPSSERADWPQGSSPKNALAAATVAVESALLGELLGECAGATCCSSSADGAYGCARAGADWFCCGCCADCETKGYCTG